VAGLAVLINRGASKFARDRALLAATEKAAGPDAVIIETHDLPELDAAAFQVRHAQPDTVALCGGDGSFMNGMTALRAAYGRAPLPRIAFIPGGAVSTVARNFGMHGAANVELARLVARHQAGTLRTVSHRTIDANGRLGSIFGTALVAKFFELYYRDGAGSYADAARMVARIFVESFVGGTYARDVLEPVECALSVDGVPLSPDRYSLICCATIRDLGLHMTVSYRNAERDDALHWIASSLPPRRLGPQMFRVIAGERIRGEPHFDGFVRTASIVFPQPFHWVLDGEMFRDRKIDVRLGPKIEVCSDAVDAR